MNDKNTNNITVAIVEDDEEIKNLLTIIIDGSPGFECSQNYANCEDAVKNIPKNQPNVVLMDIDLPRISGIEGVRLLKESLPETDFIMLTIKEDDDSVFNSLAAGATGYLLKDTPPVLLLQSIKEVVQGGSPMSPMIARKVLDSFRKNLKSPLTERETEVLKRLCEGENYKTIAGALFVSGNTVRAHIKNIYKKLHVNTRAAAVSKAINENLV
ncbi:MAG: response regulator transcription factor [Melioribacteraceae bacterium]|nr:response regulator transcription factor [Melioribacteraceae bacterium]MCO6495828.1 response regulator transcription factor [Bacteroidota bacterium]